MHLLGMDEIASDTAMDQYSELLTNFLASKPQFQKDAFEFFIQTPQTSIPEARKMKNHLRNDVKKMQLVSLLPFLPFSSTFSVRNIHKTHIQDHLDHLATKFLKSWLNFPSREVRDLGIFHQSTPLRLKFYSKYLVPKS